MWRVCTLGRVSQINSISIIQVLLFGCQIMARDILHILGDSLGQLKSKRVYLFVIFSSKETLFFKPDTHPLKGNHPIKSTIEFLLKCHSVVKCCVVSEK